MKPYNNPAYVELRKFIDERVLVDDAKKDLEYVLDLIEAEECELHQLASQVKEQTTLIKELQGKLEQS